MHPEVRSETPGRCPKCGGMELVPEQEAGAGPHSHLSKTLKDYQPLLIIVGLILLVSIVATWKGGGNWIGWMRTFMAGFFLVFSAFKLIDLPGFADGYASYDLLAKHFKTYGYVYPFLELALGFAYLTGVFPTVTDWVTFFLMAFSGVGVAMSMMEGKKFQCACLGTLLKVPLTTVTLVEDFGMAAMALLMLLIR